MLDINKVIETAYEGGVLTEYETSELYHFLRHIPNSKKTEKEWEVYKKFCVEKGLPEPNRKSCVRPLNEKYDENGNLTTPVRD